MDTSVAICTWNRCEILRETLGHFTEMVVSPDLEWELIVVNNNGTDHTDAVCESFRGRLPIRVLQEPTPGQSFARNLAVREARGRILAWTDDDVVVAREWLSEIDKAFASYAADFVFGPSAPKWPREEPAWFSERFRGNFAVLDYGPEPFVDTDPYKPFFGLNFAGTLAAHRALGGFKTEYGLKGNAGGVGEDVDLFGRALRSDMKIVYSPSVFVRHMIAEERIHKRYHRRRHWVALPVYYTHLHDVFPATDWVAGVPRFFFGRFVDDVRGWIVSAASGKASDRFHYELQVLRFIGLMVQSARHGFRRPVSTKEHSLAESSHP